MTLQGLGDKTYGLLQVPSQWTILHASQVLSVSSSKLCIVYACICVLRFLLKNIFYYMYTFKMGKNNKEKGKKKKSFHNSFQVPWDQLHSVNYIRSITYLLKGTLMQIWKSPHMFVFIQKYYPENFPFLMLGILELYARKACEIIVYKHTETIEYVKN